MRILVIGYVAIKKWLLRPVLEKDKTSSNFILITFYKFSKSNYIAPVALRNALIKMAPKFLCGGT